MQEKAINQIARKLRRKGFAFYQCYGTPPIGSIIQDYKRKGKPLHGVVYTTPHPTSIRPIAFQILHVEHPSIEEDQQKPCAEQVAGILRDMGLIVSTHDEPGPNRNVHFLY